MRVSSLQKYVRNPLQQTDDTNSHHQTHEGVFGPFNPDRPSATGTDPAPGNLHGTGDRQKQAGNVGASRIDEMAANKVGETCRHTATGTGNAEDFAKRAGRQTDPAMRAESARVRLKHPRDGKPAQQKQAPADEQHTRTRLQREPVSNDVVGCHDWRLRRGSGK